MIFKYYAENLVDTVSIKVMPVFYTHVLYMCTIWTKS
jgi:hypothetical protein